MGARSCYKIEPTGLFMVAWLLLFFHFGLAAQEEGYKIRTIVLDAGHGGKDVGCLGSSSHEKDIALGITLQLGAYINEYLPDVKVIYTRSSDVFIPLDQRAHIANEKKADLFISIHCNSASNRAAFGTETWVMGMHRSEANLEVAKRENAVIMLEENYEDKYDYDPTSPVAHIIFSIQQYAFQDQSIDLAHTIQEQFRTRAGRKDRGVKQAGLVVLYKTAMPSVLVEAGFLSNSEEEKFLRSKYGQEIIASAIFRGIRDYKVAMEKDYEAIARERINPKNLSDIEKKTRLEGEKQVAVNQEKNTSVVNEQKPETPGKSQSTAANHDKKEKEIPAGNAENIEYRVQIFASARLSDLNAPPFNRLKKVYTDQTRGGIFRYFYGSFYELPEARKALKEAREAGFSDAFLAAYKNGLRVDMPKSFATSE